MRIHHFLVSCILAVATLSAHAFERPFPENAKRGLMTPDNYPRVVINDKPRVLSAGSRIWNQDNLIEMPASLRGEDLPVFYTENFEGDIDRIWILTPEEAKRSAPKPVPLPTPLPAPKPLPKPVPTPEASN
ncbi:MAG TPA: hypothetical protein VN114_01040 [Oxalicibacterium sp.]|uniref:hypothetical protein n=1 Tax=Oxalicibacterium sp. TaxID=2766525 RepID=UPI002C9586FC|nr:hypothetical protein [Oxalicibacterium sp.]HWU97071.1 hypothetical protein [Oxalicibacterium sp.]